MTTALEGVEGSESRPGRSLPPVKTRYPLYRRRGGPQGRSGQVRKISPPPEFDPRTVQPIASRFNDWAIAVHKDILTFMITSGRIILRVRNASDKSCSEKRTHILCSVRFLLQFIWYLWGTEENYGTARQATDNNIIRRMGFGCRRTKVKIQTHTENM